MGRWVVAIVVLGMLLGIGIAPAHAQLSGLDNAPVPDQPAPAPTPAPTPAPQPAAPTATTLQLPTLGLTIQVPAGPAWQVEPDPSSDSPGDFVKRSSPVQLSIKFARISGKQCQSALSAVSQSDPKQQPRSAPPYLPSSWHSTALEHTEDGIAYSLSCFDTSGGIIVAIIGYAGSIDSSDATATLEPLLGAVAGAVGAGGPSTPAAASPAASGTTLVETRVTIELPDGWTYEHSVDDDGDGTDMLARSAAPALIIIPSRSSGGGCAAGYSRLEAKGVVIADRRTSLVPASWHHRMGIQVVDGKAVVIACYDTPDGMILATIVYGGSPDDIGSGDMDAAYPVLERIANAATGESATSSSGSSSGGDSSDDGGDFDPDDVSMWAELLGYQLTPDDGDLEKLMGGMLRIYGFAPADEGLYLAAEYGFGAGYDAKSNIPIDVHMGFGPGLGFGGVTIAPVLGVGMDSMGGSEADDAGNRPYRFSAAFYYYGKVALGVGLGPVGLGLTGGRYFRGGIDGTANRHVSEETRLGVRLTYERYALGGTYAIFDDSDRRSADLAAKLMGASLGMAF